MKHLEDTPWMICDETDTNFCAYSDTDSVYIHSEPLLRNLYHNWDELEDNYKDELLEKTALYYQNYITKHYDTLAKECFNVQEHRLEMKTECVIRAAYFRKTRRYAQWITKQEGVFKEKLDVKGLEFKKANFPKVLGKFFHEAIIDVLKGSKQVEIDKRIEELKSLILKGKMPLSDLGIPTGVKKLNQYIERKPKAGEMFTVMKKGAPVNTKAAVIYNDLIRFWGLNKEHSYIAQGDKIKYIYLKPNPYQVDALGFLDFDIPDKVNEFMEKYADRNKIFESILLNKLENFYDDLGWRLNLNPYLTQFFNFD
jgi:DNA polymerase elongation subunit (family B)